MRHHAGAHYLFMLNCHHPIPTFAFSLVPTIPLKSVHFFLFVLYFPVQQGSIAHCAHQCLQPGLGLGGKGLVLQAGDLSLIPITQRGKLGVDDRDSSLGKSAGRAGLSLRFHPRNPEKGRIAVLCPVSPVLIW